MKWGQTEKREQKNIVDLFKTFGAIVVNTSQARPSKITRGIPDLFVMFPIRKVAFWFEVKRVGGSKIRQLSKMTVEQAHFRANVMLCGVKHYYGAFDEAKAALKELGII